MTDVAELVEWLRHKYPCGQTCMKCRAAHALESQAKEIADLLDGTMLEARVQQATAALRLDVVAKDVERLVSDGIIRDLRLDVARLEGEVTAAKPLLDEALAYDALLSSMGIPRIGAPTEGERAWDERELRKADIGLTMAARAFAKAKEAKT